jgi:CheY-like chemotaxis protein
MNEGTAPPPETKPTSNSPVPTEPTPSAPAPTPPTEPIPEPPTEPPAEQTLSPTEKPKLPSEPIPTPAPPKPTSAPEPSATPTSPLGSQAERPAEQAKKILLVDDDPVFTQLYASVFNSAGLNCVTAEHGLEALDAAKEEKPDLILLDIMMPDINGFEVLKRLKVGPTTAQIPVWMLTNLAEQIDQETATSLGASGYLVKSTNTPKQVCQKIDAFFAGVIDKP